jgi:hypothetical protein
VINNGLLITGFASQLPSWPLCLAQCDLQRSAPGITQLVDPTHHDTVDQSVNARPTPESQPPPRPTIIPSGTQLRQRP